MTFCDFLWLYLQIWLQSSPEDASSHMNFSDSWCSTFPYLPSNSCNCIRRYNLLNSWDGGKDGRLWEYLRFNKFAQFPFSGSETWAWTEFFDRLSSVVEFCFSFFFWNWKKGHFESRIYNIKVSLCCDVWTNYFRVINNEWAQKCSKGVD